MKPRECLLVFRFSAMGDVAMCASVLKDFCEQHPEIAIIFVSRESFEPFFKSINNLQFHRIEPTTRHRGASGLYRLYKELVKYKPTAIADLHNNLRSNALCFYFRVFAKVNNVQIDKERAAKKKLTRKQNKVVLPLKATTERYADVFRKLGFDFDLSNQLKRERRPIPASVSAQFNTSSKFLGISPFAKHKEKVYPLEKMEQVIHELNRLNYKIFTFGGGEEEFLTAKKWEEKYDNVTSLIHKLTLSEELDVISNLDLMVSMDSSGMHMASLMGVPVVSIWGATHPAAGFLGYGQAKDDCIQIDLYCRPCSVFGNKICYRGDWACMHGIDSGMIVEHIKAKLNTT